jgi:hypothetical protein
MQPRLLPVLLFLLALSCGGSSSSPDAGDVVNCQNDPRVATYAPPVTVTSSAGGLKMSLVKSDPAPPARGNDTWDLHVTNAGGTAMPGLSLGVKTLMPDHGHGSPTTPTISDKGGGDYQVTPLYLFMPGVWHIWFFSNAAPTDTADFYFCVQG